MSNLGDRIRYYRLRAGLSLRDVEERSHSNPEQRVRHTTVGLLERGERTRPNLATLDKIAIGLGVKTADLVDTETLPDMVDRVRTIERLRVMATKAETEEDASLLLGQALRIERSDKYWADYVRLGIELAPELERPAPSQPDRQSSPE